MTRYTANKHKRDGNHKELVEYFRKAGAVVDDVSQVSGLGYDLIVNYRGCVVMVEAKDGSKPPSGRRLTDSEREAQLRHGAKFAVVESILEAQGLLESMAEHGRCR